MKKQLSVFGLMARKSAPRFFGLMGIMTAVELILLYLAGTSAVSIEYFFEKLRFDWVFCYGALTLLTALLCRSGCEYGGGKQGYTLMRLSVSEKAVYLWQAAFNALALLTFWGLQAALCLAAGLVYVKNADPSLVSGQTIFLGFWRTTFFHNILPMQDMFRTITWAVYIIAYGFVTAAFPVMQRKGKFAISTPFVLGLGYSMMSIPMGGAGYDVVMWAFLTVIAWTMIVKANRKEQPWES